ILGVLMIVYVLIGGMKGTTCVQIIKAILLIAGAVIMTVWSLALFGFVFNAMLGAAVERNPKFEAIFEPGLQYGASA
ncbi:cation acetate symporter, partial [Micrococcus sp. SIMBA_131]